MSQINVTPFVDVMLVLLVIFMVTAPMMESGIDVNLPKTEAGAVTAPQEPVTITISRLGDIFVSGTLIERDSLGEKLKAVFAKRTEKTVYLKADEKVDYGRVASVMAEIRRAGIDRIAMITETAPDSKEQR